MATKPSLIAMEATTTDRVDGVLEALRAELATLALQLRMATAHAEAMERRLAVRGGLLGETAAPRPAAARVIEPGHAPRRKGLRRALSVDTILPLVAS